MTTLLLFATIKEAAGTPTVDVEATTVGEALQVATALFGARFASVLKTCSIVVDHQTVPRDTYADRRVGPTDEIAVLPPVSGGQDFRMVDVGDKEETKREATAVCVLTCSDPGTRNRLLSASVAKGDAVGPAKVAGTFAAKRVPELIPLCHPIRTTFVGVECAPVGEDGIEVRATVRGIDRTGFEIEAMTAASIAALTLYDFAKAEDPRMRIGDLRIIAKSGGKSGTVTFE